MSCDFLHLFLPVALLLQHHSYITAFDFSTDGQYLQSNDGAFELLFSNFFGEYMAQATALADVEWASQSCALGWGVKGLWPAINDGTIYTATARSLEGVCDRER